MNTDKLKQLARDLRKTPPRSTRDVLGGFVVAARMPDKARADLLGARMAACVCSMAGCSTAAAGIG